VLHDGILLCMHDCKLCMHDGMLDAIDMLEMCTLNLTQFTPQILTPSTYILKATTASYNNVASFPDSKKQKEGLVFCGIKNVIIAFPCKSRI